MTLRLIGGRGYIVVEESFRTPSNYTCLGCVVLNAKKKYSEKNGVRWKGFIE